MNASEYSALTIDQSAEMKGMWAGGMLPITSKKLFGIKCLGNTYFMDILKCAHTPALFKIIDEIIVNACDHAKMLQARNHHHKVTEIKITFKSGIVSVYNDGPGIPTDISPDSTEFITTKRIKLPEGEQMRIPDMICAVMLSGVNSYKGVDNIRGGVNGCGCKLANIHSERFMMETDDGKMHYKREWRNRKSLPMPVFIEPSTGKQFTKVTFLPVYEKFGYEMPLIGNLHEELDAYIRLGAFRTAAYLGSSVTVTYNGSVIKSNIEILSILLSGSKIDTESNPISSDDALTYLMELYSSREVNNLYPLQVAMILIEKEAKNKTAFKSLSIINGVTTPQGPHIDYINKIIIDNVIERYKAITKSKKDIDVRTISKYMRIVIMGPIPGADWGAQNKEELQISDEIMNSYTFPKKHLENATKLMCDFILSNETGKQKVVHKKYEPAKNIKNKGDRSACILMCAEGDSAIEFCSNGLRMVSRDKVPRGGPSPDWVGTISLNGVPLNAMNEVSYIDVLDNKGNKKTIRVRSESLKENETYLCLADAMNLSYEMKYETPEEIRTLNYGRMVICVDQDLDGCGKIAPLVVAWIHTFWPALIKNGIICRFLTPLIRIYPKKIEMYYQDELEQYIKTNSIKGTTIKYYKGLGSHHPKDEVPKMFEYKNFINSIYTYYYDQGAGNAIEEYFGKDSDCRKTILRTPIKYTPIDYATHRIPILKSLLEYDTKLYKNDALYRQIPSIMDGLNESKRKAIFSSGYFTNAKPEAKVFMFTSHVIEKTHYVHGPASMDKTILGWMSEINPIKYFIPAGQVGTIHSDNTSSSRYVFMSKSKLIDATFPRDDLPFLTYNMEEGEIIEPRYYIPVAPVAVLDNIDNVSEGWNHISYGRDIDYVTKFILSLFDDKNKINELLKPFDILEQYENIFSLTVHYPLYLHLYKNNSKIMMGDNGIEYSVGTYEVHGDTVIITSLPYLKLVNSYMHDMTYVDEEKPNDRLRYIVSYTNESYQNNIRIVFNMAINFHDDVKDLVNFFMLKKSLQPQLQYYSPLNTINSCINYHHIIIIWARMRIELYLKRLQRQEIITELSIIRLENKIRFININLELNITAIKDEDIAIEKLAELNFNKLNHSAIDQPKFRSVEEIRIDVYNDSASYDYLLHMRSIDMVIKSKNKLEKELAELREQLVKIKWHINEEKPFAGYSIWKKEYFEFYTIYKSLL